MLLLWDGHPARFIHKLLQITMSTPLIIEAEILAICPNFKEWNKEHNWWTTDDGNFTLYGLFAAFSHYILDCLIQDLYSETEMIKVFNFIESKMIKEDFDVYNAVATCFLENLMNNRINITSSNKFIPLLGANSREFCQAWDDRPEIWAESS
ncbi:hypothetical protein NIES4071_61470 [Calothrix sp. NIES-4071]|nr:hypothetical protein NIES4071_61470 [Calothrix sp. NIES-4071]BAZ60451.1 hypothetical protein NIES4105_61420 [Calothrix sp. NIES-4105]